MDQSTLHRDLEQLRAQKTGELAEQLRDARSFGSANGNDELWAIREDEAILDARIALLEESISRSSVVDHEPPIPGVAAIRGPAPAS